MAKLEEAKKLAEELVEEMKPNCERVMVAGSIRRGKPEVKDVEVVAIPKWETVEIPENLSTLFVMDDAPKKVNRLYNWATLGQSRIQWIKPGVSEAVPWEIKEDGKYWRGLIFKGVSERIKLDLFLLNPQNWGVLATIRTGPAKFSEALVTFIKKRTPYRVQLGHLTLEETGEIIPCPEEEDFFRNAGVRFVSLAERERDNPYSILQLKNK